MQNLIFIFLILLPLSCTQKPDVTSVNISNTEKSNASNESLNLVSAAKNNLCDNALSEIPAYQADRQMFKRIYDFYKKYNSCMDAGIAEGMENITVRTLHDDWRDLSALSKLIKQDSDFEDFILKNINSLVTGLTAEVTNLEKLAKAKCPKGEEQICAKIQKYSKQALDSEKAELEEIQKANN